MSVDKWNDGELLFDAVVVVEEEEDKNSSRSETFFSSLVWI